ncbi:MAG: hypothetical protein E6K09_02575 [Methanobacteriota archaeon]|nr:MAG: hypothetical protein E6K09_02575 [Euryarchaeota archaeon]
MTREHRPGSRAFLVAVFAAIAMVIGVSFLAFSLRPPPAAPSDHVVFSNVMLLDGNATFAVQNVSGGPYTSSGFGIVLIVNDFSAPSAPLGPNGSSTLITIGPNHYHVGWTDTNGDSAVDVGDRFFVSGDGGPLPALSYYEFDLRWEMEWTAKATWSTS